MEREFVESQQTFKKKTDLDMIKTDMEILKMKAEDCEGEDLEIFRALKESVRAKYLQKIREEKVSSIGFIHTAGAGASAEGRLVLSPMGLTTMARTIWGGWLRFIWAFKVHTKQSYPPWVIPTTHHISSNSGGPPTNLSTGTGRRSHRNTILHRPSSPPDKQPVTVEPMSLKQNDIAGIQTFFFHETAPSFGQHVALTTVPIGVAEPPRLPGLVLETQQQPFLLVCGGGGGGVSTAEREIFLGVLFGNDETVELSDVAGR
ncbi:hypothetical protein LXL04_014398 [Taraxacum kok-saghyz]